MTTAEKNIKIDRVHILLDKMINELEYAGVDVSYFPLEAQAVIRRYATKIMQETIK